MLKFFIPGRKNNQRASSCIDGDPSLRTRRYERDFSRGNLKAVEESHPKRYNFWYGLLIVEVYIAIGVFMYVSGVLGMKLKLVDAILFCALTFTTVGYGAPFQIQGNAEAMIFTSFYILFGVLIVAVILSDLVDTVLESRIISAEKKKNEATADFDNAILENRRSGSMQDVYEEAENNLENESRWMKRNFARQLVAVIIPIVVFFFLSVYYWKDYEYPNWDDQYYDDQYYDDQYLKLFVNNHPYVTAFYYTVMTISTVGYGDVGIVPYYLGVDGKEYEKLVLSIMLPIVVVSMGSIIGRVSRYRFDKRLLVIEQEILSKGLNADDLCELDEDNNGEVTMLEFVESMLVNMGKVDKQLITKLKQQFLILDVDGSGTLTIDDLKDFYSERNLVLEDVRKQSFVAREKTR